MAATAMRIGPMHRSSTDKLIEANLLRHQASLWSTWSVVQNCAAAGFAAGIAAGVMVAVVFSGRSPLHPLWPIAVGGAGGCASGIAVGLKRRAGFLAEAERLRSQALEEIKDKLRNQSQEG